MDDVKSLLSMAKVMRLLSKLLSIKLGKSQMPAKTYLFHHKYNGDLRIVSSYLKRYDISAVKIVNSHPEDRIILSSKLMFGGKIILEVIAA
ncbi:MAG: hypothetical protein QXH37_03065 [Candidatus Bathyarchaeia archaeon]